MSATVSSSDFSDFPSAFKGPVVRPEDADYGEVRKIWSTRRDEQVPALIARATDVEDVVVAVKYAASKEVSIAVRGGGHGIECYAMPHDALVIDMSMMKAVTVDPESGKTTVQAGALWADVYAASEPHGSVVPGGTVSTVGVAGFTLGGGLGHLTRRFGATIDSLLSVDVVTTDGRVVTASADENAELFWGLRGAGQNLAIAVSFTFRGHALESVVNTNFFYTPEDSKAVLAGINSAIARAPRELSVSPIVQQMGAYTGVPEEIVGKPIVLLAVIYTGPREQYEAAIGEIRALAPIMYEMEGPSTWREVNSTIDVWMPAGRRWYNGGGYLAEITAELGELVLECVGEAPEGGELHMPILGGAMHDVAEDSAAMSREGADWCYEITAQWDSADDDDVYVGWVEKTAERLAPFTLPNGYINLNPEHGAGGIPAMYGSPEKWQRIVALKQTWDPENRLSYNKNIPPQTS